HAIPYGLKQHYRLLRGFRRGCCRCPPVGLGASSASDVGSSSSAVRPLRAAFRARRSSKARSASDPGVGELRITHHCWPRDQTFDVDQYSSTPIATEIPEMTNTPGSRYINIFC